MAAIAHRTATPSTSNTGTYASGSFTPTAGALLVVLVEITASAGLGTLTGSTGLTFTRVASVEGETFNDSLEAFIADAFATAVPQTVSYTSADPGTGSVISVEEVTGMLRTGLLALRQFKGAQGSGSTAPSVTFDAACLTGNPTLGIAHGGQSNPLGVTPPTGWAELVDTGFSTPTSGVETCGRDSGFTGSTITWGSAVANDNGALILELDASAPPATAPTKMYQRRMRAA